jgi:hypothetical protein
MNKAKKLSSKILLLTIMLGVFSLSGFFFNATPIQATATPSDIPTPTLLVAASSTVTASPDQARVSMAVVSYDSNLSQAQESNNSNTQKLIAAIKNTGISDDNIKTINYSVYPQYNYRDTDSTPEIIGYQVRNEILLVVNKIAELGYILDTAVKAGANNINYINFEKANTEAEQNRALAQAVQRAHSKAVAIAAAAGMSLGNIVSINEGGVNTYMPRNQVSFAEKDLQGLGSSVPINPGDLEITASISIMYELK